MTDNEELKLKLLLGPIIGAVLFGAVRVVFMTHDTEIFGPAVIVAIAAIYALLAIQQSWSKNKGDRIKSKQRHAQIDGWKAAFNVTTKPKKWYRNS